MVRRAGLKWWSGAAFVLCVLCAKGCVLSFEEYPEADLCAAALDAGIRIRTAPDPVLRACDAGRQTDEEDASLSQAGASASEGSQ